LFQVLRTIPAAGLAAVGARRLPGRPAFGDLRDLITSIWPIIINTAVGIRKHSQTYRNVAAGGAAQFVEFFTKVMIPAAAPYNLHRPAHRHLDFPARDHCGEMRSGGVGIGFFIWDAWNSSISDEIILALSMSASSASCSTA